MLVLSIETKLLFELLAKNGSVSFPSAKGSLMTMLDLVGGNGVQEFAENIPDRRMLNSCVVWMTVDSRVQEKIRTSEHYVLFSINRTEKANLGLTRI